MPSWTFAAKSPSAASFLEALAALPPKGQLDSLLYPIPSYLLQGFHRAQTDGFERRINGAYDGGNDHGDS
jgi:hypothetical protein